MLLTVFGGLVAVTVIETFVLKPSVGARRALSIPLRRPHLAPLSSALRDRLVIPAAPLASSDYRTNALPSRPTVDWSRLDHAHIERSGSTKDVQAEFSPEHATVYFSSWKKVGKSRFLWSLLYDARIEGDALVLLPRLYVGGVVLWLAVGVAILAGRSLPAVGYLALAWAVIHALTVAHVASSKRSAFADKAVRLLEGSAQPEHVRVDDSAAGVRVAVESAELLDDVEAPVERTFRRG